MEEVLKVSIGGVSFAINKDGYARMDSYLRGIESHYAKRPGGKEIVDDIESRIAELLLEKHTKDDVVTLERVDSVIAVMGTPSQFDDQQDSQEGEGQPSGQATGFTPSQPNPPRRLFRDNEDRMIGGVCSGLAHYFKFDPSVLRIILGVIIVLHFFGKAIWGWYGFYGIRGLPSLFSLCFLLI